MSHLTNQVIQDAKNGSEAAIAAVLAAMMPRLRCAASKGICPGLELEDALQEGIIGLFAALRTYDVQGNAGFETYASACIQNAVLAAKRSASRKKHGPLNQSVPFNDEQLAPGPEELAIRREQMENTIAAISRRLSPFEQEVLALFINGSTYQQIADRLGCTAKAVENALFRLRRKLRKEESSELK